MKNMIEVSNNLFTKLGVSEQFKHRLLIVFKDENAKIDEFPDIAKLSDWTYADHLNGYKGESTLSLTQIQQLFRKEYGLNKEQVSVRDISGTWASIL
ncbi:hypothetical protein [Streptococcus bovimastitidis]|uniref:hypothetical protein n=1 Tax=Streptococcus bovimastitidis TaxID=1856638 RepID=UPI0010424611|nr:hypothetical protein [Streptococcus bovimastitidis]